LNSALAPKTKLPDYWSWSNNALWNAYSGTCAYLAIYFEWPTGASSTDHFAPKSKHAGLAYEWDNYRLSCLGPNRNKNKYTDVLDPIGLAVNTFVLNLASGQIKPNAALVGLQKVAAVNTIKRLKLDSPHHNAMRARHFAEYIVHGHKPTLKKQSPFVWYEADRQGLL
jgi:uncharacterized protein (TIGR02646 family)